MINRLRAGETSVWDLDQRQQSLGARGHAAGKADQAARPGDRSSPSSRRCCRRSSRPTSGRCRPTAASSSAWRSASGPIPSSSTPTRSAAPPPRTRAGISGTIRPTPGKYGILESDDWNVFNIFLIAGIDPFREHTPDEMTEVRGDGEDGLRRRQGGRRHRDDEPGADLGRDRLPADRRHLFGLAGAGGRVSATCAAITPLKSADRGQGRGVVDRDHLDGEQPEPVAAGDGVPEVRAGAGGGAYRRLRRGDVQPGDADGQSGVLRSLQQAEELDAIQWDSLEEEMARSAEYNIVPDYDAALDLMTAAKRARG